MDPTGHPLHGVPPVWPVGDVAAAAEWLCRRPGFEIDFIAGAPAQHGRVKVGNDGCGQPIYIHLHRSPDPVRPGGELRLHSHPVVLAMWEPFAAASGYVSLNDLAEAARPFSEFTPP